MIQTVVKVVSVRRVNSMNHSFEILRAIYNVDKHRYEESAKAFATICFEMTKQCGVIKESAELFDYKFKYWNIELDYLYEGKKFGIIFDYTSGSIDDIMFNIQKGRYEEVFFTKKERK